MAGEVGFTDLKLLISMIAVTTLCIVMLRVYDFSVALLRGMLLLSFP
jgi:hypothetical protein